MPPRNTIKQYIEEGYYHIYNRGVEKRLIFQDEQDYGVFLSYIKEYLLPKDRDDLSKQLANPKLDYVQRDKLLKKLRLNNFADEITLLAYCLMPNHFHIFVKQESSRSIDRFMRSLGTRYTMYFNRKNKRVGHLFQSIYKAALVTTEEHFIYLTKYIHRQALASQGSSLENQPSSYMEYLGKRNTQWVKPDEVLSYFSKHKTDFSYKNFVEEDADFGNIHSLILEDD